MSCITYQTKSKPVCGVCQYAHFWPLKIGMDELGEGMLVPELSEQKCWHYGACGISAHTYHTQKKRK